MMEGKHLLVSLVTFAVINITKESQLLKAWQKPTDVTSQETITTFSTDVKSQPRGRPSFSNSNDPKRAMGMTSSRDDTPFPLPSQEDFVLEVGVSLWQVLRPKVEGCQFVLVTGDSKHPLIRNVLRQSYMFMQPLVLVDLNSRLRVPETIDQLTGILRSANAICRTVMVDLMAGDDSHAFRFLEESKLWLWPEANVVVVGNRRKARLALQHPALRNTFHPLFVGFHDETITNAFEFKSKNSVENASANNIQLRQESSEIVFRTNIGLYTRCLYCNNGQPKTWILSSQPLGSNIPHQMPMNGISSLDGHRLKIVSLAYPPYAVYVQNEEGPGGVVALLDSLDKRILDTISLRANFTYEIRSPKDMQFGMRFPNGSWTGMVGAIDRNEADFTTIIGISADRTSVIDHQRTIDIEQLIITSLKPQPLTQYSVFLRPFTFEVWMFLGVFIVVWGVSLWYLQRIRSQYSGDKPMAFNTAIFSSLAILLGDPPPSKPTNATGQLLVGWWLISGLLIATGFKSSLVAHLTIEGKTPPIDTLSDLVKQEGWKWGFDDRILTGLVLLYLRDSTDDAVQQIYERHEKISPEEGLKKVLKGSYSILSTKDRVVYLIGTQYTDEFGQSPFYISKQSYNIVPALGWGFRKGAPFKPRISQLIRQLTESGLSSRWLNELVTINIRRIREGIRQKQQQNFDEVDQKEEVTTETGVRVLRMVHMMGVYLVLCGGLALSSLLFVAERGFTHFVGLRRPQIILE